ncbi:S-layer homology domain-containing protein, partial [Brevibacillus sp. SYSU BS000544]|uniref:S-layer homology domain-containing protein n=1 Tax=Brevibacillus sp. SYSU BS000544 TaxID=3416443 RepID=UPI003CE5A022
TNTTGKTASISVTVDAEAVTTKDITAVASLPAITGLANGTAKTASALGLPAQVKVSLSDNSKINVDVNWDVASTIYNPATKTAQTFTVIGTPVNLPNGITNSQNRTASIQVSVKAADVIEVPKYIVEVINPSAIKDVANGTKKTASALGLPTQVEVTLSDNSRINVDVSWDVADSSYDPGNKEEQKFTVTGTLVNLPNGVNNSQGLTASIRITVNAADVVEVPKDIVEVINPSAIKDVANGTKKTAAALGLPEVVSVKLDDGSTIEVEVSWDVADSSYDPSTEEEQTFTVTGELVNLLKGVTNSQNLEASIRVTVEGADVVGQPRNIVEVFDPSAIKDVANGTKKTASALGLPEKVKVKLDDGTTIKVEVSWDVADSSYDPDNKKEQRFTVKGTLVNLPDGIENSKELNVTIRVVVDAAPKRDNDRGKDRDERPNTNDSSTPKETARFVIVEAGNDRSLMEQVEIIRKMSADNKQVDEVVLNKNKANDILKKVAKNKEDAIRIVIDDLPKDAADEVSVKVAKAALGLIKEQNVSIEIKTNDVTITISKEMVGTLGNELYFRIVPIKKPEEEQSVSKRTINEVKRVAGGQDIQIVSKPMMIETNYSNLRTKVMFPLDDVNLPTELTAQRAFLSSLAVYVDHMDGTNELKNGEIQYDQNGKPIGIEIEIDKFSTFTILSLKGKQEVVHHQSYMMGYSDLTFKPNSALTRAELASILVHFLNAVDTQQAGEVETSFADVHANHWAAKSIQQVRNAGLMMGDGNGLFHPNAKITRAEMAVIISKWKKLTIPGKGTVFFDIKGHWAEESIMAVAESGTMKGYDERSFRPNQGLTRAEAVTLFNRLTNRGPISGVTVEIWTDVPRSHWAFAEIAEATMPHTATKQVDGTEFVSD